MMVPFHDIPVGATIKTPCGQVYRKRSSRTLEMAPGHTHYNPDHVRWFYAQRLETFEVTQ